MATYDASRPSRLRNLGPCNHAGHNHEFSSPHLTRPFYYGAKAAVTQRMRARSRRGAASWQRHCRLHVVGGVPAPIRALEQRRTRLLAQPPESREDVNKKSDHQMHCQIQDRATATSLSPAHQRWHQCTRASAASERASAYGGTPKTMSILLTSFCSQALSVASWLCEVYIHVYRLSYR